MERSFQRRLIVGQASIVLVLAAAVATAILALRSTEPTAQATQSRARIERLDQLRTDARELARSARRHLLTRDLQERQRVLALEARVNEGRGRLGADAYGEATRELQRELELYVSAVTRAMSEDPGELAATLARFEDDLARARGRLGDAFGELVAQERALASASGSSRRLVRGARWALLIAGALGLALAVGVTVAVIRLAARRREQTWRMEAEAQRAARAHRELLDAASALRGPVDAIVDRCARLRSMKPRDEAHQPELEAIALSASQVARLLDALVDATAAEMARRVPGREPSLLR